MSQIILDDHLFDLEVLIPIARWMTVQRLRNLRPQEVIKDERVPVLLRELRQPTFVTIDMGFWNRDLLDAHYCVLCFSLSSDEQYKIPDLLRRLLNMPEFRSKAVRMGKVVRVNETHIHYWQLNDHQLYRLGWPDIQKR